MCVYSCSADVYSNSPQPASQIQLTLPVCHCFWITNAAGRQKGSVWVWVRLRQLCGITWWFHQSHDPGHVDKSVCRGRSTSGWTGFSCFLYILMCSSEVVDFWGQLREAYSIALVRLSPWMYVCERVCVRFCSLETLNILKSSSTVQQFMCEHHPVWRNFLKLQAQG